MARLLRLGESRLSEIWQDLSRRYLELLGETCRDLLSLVETWLDLSRVVGTRLGEAGFGETMFGQTWRDLARLG